MTSTARCSLALALALAVMAATGCSEEPPNATPEGAVQELALQLRHHGGSSAESERAFSLLSAETRRNLELRAERYSAASGKHIPAHMMIAPASFRESFEGQHYESEIAGTQALVRIRGLLAEDEAVVRCVYEEGGWRVHIPLPPLPGVVVRPRDERPKR